MGNVFRKCILFQGRLSHSQNSKGKVAVLTVKKEGIFMRMFMMIFVLAVSLVLSGCAGSADTKPKSSGATVAAPQTSSPTARFVVAGSGTNLPLTAKLAAAYKQTSG